MGKNKIKKQDIFVSTVITVEPESSNASEYVQGLSGYLQSRYANYEIIVIDNRASVEEVIKIADLLSQLPCIRLIRLSRKHKHDTVVFAGIEAAIGDYVVVVDPEIDPVDAIEKVVEIAKEHDVVQGVSSTPIKSFSGTQFGRKIFYWYNRKYLGIDIPVHATYFIALSRRAVNALTITNRHDRHIRHLSRTIGHTFTTYEYNPVNNPSYHHSLKTNVIQALEIVSNYSTHPLRLITWLGFLAGLVNLMYGVYVAGIAIFSSNVEPGWTTMSMQMSVMFFILFAILVVLSEYIGRILGESRQDPRYIIVDELSSTVSIADTKRRNITA